MRLLSAPMYRVVGILESIWLLCSDCCDEGNIGKYTDEEIADYMGWDGPQSPSELVRHLSDAGWLDPDEHDRWVVHDWLDHCPEYIRDRVRKRQARGTKPRKQRSYVPSEPDKAGHSGTFSESPGLVPSIPNQSQPNPTNSNQTKPNTLPAGAGADPAVDEFVASWNATSGVTACRSVTAKRIKLLKLRLKDPEWNWRDALKKFPLRCFANEPNGWKPDIEWILGPDAVTKILEGKYDWEKNNGKQQRSFVGPGQRHDSGATQDGKL